MQCLVVAVRPLQVKELAEFLAFDFSAEGIPRLDPNWRWEDQEEAVMSACSSLVTIVKDGDSQIVQFSHFSVKEYLTANRLAEPIRDVSRYHIRLEAAHMILVRACLGVLLGFDDRVDRVNIKDFPLADYAAEYWAAHAQFGNVSSRIKDGMECLFDAEKPHFATWLWIALDDMSFMRPKKPCAVPLFHAARLGFCNLAEHLIDEHPEHVNARSRTLGEDTPMHIAAGKGKVKIFALLLVHGADINIRNARGETPLHDALNCRKIDVGLDVGQCLLDRGADINARDKNGCTPLFDAARRVNVEFARMLLERGAEVDARTNRGSTPLHCAAYFDNNPVAQLLMEHGAEVNARDKLGRTPFQRPRHYPPAEYRVGYSDTGSDTDSDVGYSITEFYVAESDYHDHDHTISCPNLPSHIHPYDTCHHLTNSCPNLPINPYDVGYYPVYSHHHHRPHHDDTVTCPNPVIYHIYETLPGACPNCGRNSPCSE